MVAGLGEFLRLAANHPPLPACCNESVGATKHRAPPSPMPWLLQRGAGWRRRGTTTARHSTAARQPAGGGYRRCARNRVTRACGVTHVTGECEPSTSYEHRAPIYEHRLSTKHQGLQTGRWRDSCSGHSACACGADDASCLERHMSCGERRHVWLRSTTCTVYELRVAFILTYDHLQRS